MPETFKVSLFDTNPSRIYRLTIVTGFVVVVVLVLLNTLSPLRLNNDAGRYLGIVEYFKGGLDKNSDAAHDYLPQGYPYFLYMLEKARILSPFTITFFNILSVVTAAFLLIRQYQIGNKLFYLTLVLLSYINIKEYALPVSDQLFTVLFMFAVLLWSKVFKGKLLYIVPALLVTGLSIYVRTAGVAIVVGVIAYLICLNKDHPKTKRFLLGLTVLLIGAFVIFFFINLSFFERKVDYVRQLNLRELANPLNIAGRLCIHLKELGEIVINIPVSKLSGTVDRGRVQIASPLLIVFGLVSLWMYITAIKKLKLVNSFAFWAFTAYLLMIFAWPFYDTRFLIPVVPLLIFLYLYYLFNILKSRYARVGVLLIYVSLGFISLIYSDGLSLSKSFFLKHYGADASITEIYRDHFDREQKGTSAKVYDIHKDYLPFLLQEYDREPFYYFEGTKH